MKKDIDAAFVDIGDLPTDFAPYDFDELYIREFTVEDLKLVHMGMRGRVRPLSHILRAIQLCITEDVEVLTDGDLEFIMAWLRLNSYPKGPLLVNWTCNQRNMVYKDNRTFYRGEPLTWQQMAVKNIEYENCDTPNVETVPLGRYTTRIHAFDSKEQATITDPEIDFARAGTLVDFHDYIQENPHDRHMAEIARWVKKGKTFAAKLAYLNAQNDLDLYERIREARKTYHHGVSEVIQLRCRVCDYRWEHTAAPRLLSFFADNTEEDLFAIQYNLLSTFGMQSDPKMPAKMLLFYHSSMVKDKQEEAQRASGYKPLG